MFFSVFNVIESVDGIIYLRISKCHALHPADRSIDSVGWFLFLPPLNLQKLKTSVMKKTVNPVWDEDLTLAVMDASAPIKLVSI